MSGPGAWAERPGDAPGLRRSATAGQKVMIFYIIGVIVVVLAILSFLGLT